MLVDGSVTGSGSAVLDVASYAGAADVADDAEDEQHAQRAEGEHLELDLR